MDMNAFIGIASFVCGVLLMFAIHRVVFDHYASAAEDYIEELKKQIADLKKDPIRVTYEEHHTFATPDDVTNIEFWED